MKGADLQEVPAPKVFLSWARSLLKASFQDSVVSASASRTRHWLSSWGIPPCDYFQPPRTAASAICGSNLPDPLETGEQETGAHAPPVGTYGLAPQGTALGWHPRALQAAELKHSP